MIIQSNDLQPFVDRLQSHSRLTREEANAIRDLPKQTRQVQANRDIVRLGEVTEFACLVGDGIVGRFGQNAEGERQITAFHLPGDMADLHSVVLPAAKSALQALTTTTVFQVPHTAIRTLAARLPTIAEAFWRDCMIDAGILSQWVVNVGRRNSRTRMAHLFCELASRFGRKEGVNRFDFDFGITQAHLADATGLTPVHVNRTLKSLREDGLMSVQHGRVTILNWSGLRSAGEFNGGYLQQDERAAEPAKLLQLA